MLTPHPHLISRRALLVGAAAAGLVGTAPFAALAKAPLLGTPMPGYYRFKIGSIEATIVSDGPLTLGPPASFFTGATKADLEKMLADNFLPPDNIVVQQNALVVNTGDKLVLFDTGMGSAKIFGPSSGRLLANLKAAGLDPQDFDAVVLTHAHPDHCWGLMDGGTRHFPNAQIYMSEADLTFWTDEAKLGIAEIKPFIEGTRAQLLPNRERIVLVKDGQEVLPGIQALSAPGHTVGHTIYMIASQGQTLCYTGDVTHHAVISYTTPRVEFAYDTDPKLGVTTRLKTLDMLATDRTAFLAYHLPFPGIGHVVKQGEAYRFVAAPLQTVL
jgi:glyoxylase-like metal-dependent hydrolase (beta-lactamase superfamily II)